MADMQIVLAGEAEKKVEAQYVEMKVPLYSYGCERKIKKALAHLKGVFAYLMLIMCCAEFYLFFLLLFIPP